MPVTAIDTAAALPSRISSISFPTSDCRPFQRRYAAFSPLMRDHAGKESIDLIQTYTYRPRRPGIVVDDRGFFFKGDAK
jgi:hypothetical protein